MQLSLGFSPCPNDTFIFDALVNGALDTGEISFDVHLEDVQTLNEWALEGRLDVSKISYGVLPNIHEYYTLLSSGGALGRGVGPLLISREPAPDQQGLELLVNETPIAIPGKDTTAHFLFSRAFPHARHKHFMRFDDIENWVVSGKGLGVIIHENRFTYQQRGLHQWLDLGEYWEKSTGNPIPLGGIVAKRTMAPAIIRKLDTLIQQSLMISRSRYPEISDYVRCHAAEMSDTVMRNHIDLYVNDFSMNMGPQGKAAIMEMMRNFGDSGIQPDRIFAHE